MKLVFYHGWGFDSSIWEALAAPFPDCSVAERGYFGAPEAAEQEGEFLAVTHSFGTMRLLGTRPAGCRGIVAINGFDRFTATADFPGVARRVIDRMVDRFRSAPEQVLAEFRQRCGCDAPFAAIDRDRLLQDLVTLRDGNFRQEAGCGLPVLSLQGACDPILPPAMREAVFAGADRCERRTHGSGGHLLPLQDAATCAQAISAFMERLT